VKTTFWLDGQEWLAVLRIGLGAWWFESFRHKNKEAWIQRNAGIDWAGDVASKHRWGIVRTGFDRIVRPHPKAMTYVVLVSELALGVGLILGLLSPIALVASVLLNLVYFTLMIHDWAEQGQNLMMALAGVVAFGAQAWREWSLDEALGLFGT
jgi:thiosulfate dehydrogenase [quinone] large subunit